MSASVNQIRQLFLQYFATHGHQEVASSPLIPHNDPTLMFVNAGMVQFKNIFTGQERVDYTKAVTAQKCVRAGGKHNDLENVGYTARHHTFFEMLGNFSFGDYFKEEAIYHAWTMVTKELALPKDRLYVTIYHDDDDAYNYWRKIAHLSDDRIIRIATSDNFWQMGDTGPCGPCSEIFYDHGDHIWGDLPGTPDEDGDRFIEIWNLVFMQFEQFEGGMRHNLPKPSIDTGMGIERIAAVLQGKHNNYDTDLMHNLITAIANIYDSSPNGYLQSSHRVIADHIRSIAFLIADGVLPSNEGRGYVLRRIMRRAMRHAHKLNPSKQALCDILPALITEMGNHYTELHDAQSLIHNSLYHEEQKFHTMLERGLKLLDKEINNIGGSTILDGKVGFTLYDTYGFPLDLTEDILRGQNISLDRQSFNDAMTQQKERARAAWAGSGSGATDDIWFAIQNDVATPDFLGYHTNEAQAIVTAILNDKAQRVTELTAGEHGWLISNQTPFYGESGGQQGDHGKAYNDTMHASITDTQKYLGNIIAHACYIDKGTLHIDDAIMLTIDADRRQQLRAHHSTAHLLHAALRQHLGDHVTQKGSMVAPNYVRFDFAHHAPLHQHDIQQIEHIVNNHIRLNTLVETIITSPENAKSKGALALFGEKYGDEVRVLTMGGLTGDNAQPFSVELCGGTHVTRTGDIGMCVISSEENIASGVRRITAHVAESAINYYNQQKTILQEAATLLKTSEHDMQQRIARLLDEKKESEQTIRDLRNKLVQGSSLNNNRHDVVSNGNLYSYILEDFPAKDLKNFADSKRNEHPNAIILILAQNKPKASVIIVVNGTSQQHYNAVDLVQYITAQAGGKGGGGRADMAQGGLPLHDDPTMLIQALVTYLQ